MAIAKTRIHIICGICGNNEMMSFKVVSEIDDEDETKTRLRVSVFCGNCSSLTDLDELMKQED